VTAGHQPADGAVFFLRPFFRWFDRAFARFQDLYVKLVGRVLAKKLRYLLVFVLIVGAMGVLFTRMPTAYLPDEDQGVLSVQVVLPANATLEQTEAVMDKVKNYFLTREKEAVESVMAISGVSFGGNGQNMGLAFVKLKDWDLRQRPDLKVDAVAGRAMGAFSQIKEAMVFAFPPPAVIELGNAAGFDFQLQDRGGVGHETLMAARNQLLGMAARDPRLAKVRPNGMEDVPEYRIDVDWDKAGAQGVPIASIHNTISAAFGSAYVNDFIRAGRVKQVYVQADAPDRMLPGDLKKLYVRNNSGKMVPFTSFATGHWTQGSPRLERYNAFPSINIWGEPAPGHSSGEAMDAMEEIVAKLPQGIGFDWTGLSFQERMAGSQAPLLYAFSIFVIFLCLAALYESWPIPIAILMTLPLGAIGGVIASTWRGMPNDVYFQIGLLTTMGLTTKNAILIVQFARARVDEGAGLIEATLEAAKLRLRPIIMTSLAFGFGVLPLALASGAGAGAQRAIGTGVLGGMVTSTVLVTLFAPLFYVLIYKLLGRHRKRERSTSTKLILSESENHE
jgi:HAE1 family hydrophobic/amphiphilic exporter-1